MTSELTTNADRMKSLRSLLESRKAEIAAALPRHLTPDRMLRVLLTAATKTPTLLNCEPASFYAAALTASQLGLEPDGVLGHAYLIPFGKQVQFIPGYKGLIHLARRSKEISTIQAHVVHDGDRFEYEFGLSPKLVHVPLPTAKSGPDAVTFAYAVARLKDGGVQWDVLSRKEIDAVRSRSRAAQSGPWVTDYEEMAKKTALRRLCKLLPVSVELERAVALDERADVGLPQELEPLPIPHEEVPASKVERESGSEA